MTWSNMLTSGYTFTKEEYDSKLNYILFNSLLIFNILLLFIAMLLRFFKENYIHASIDMVYVLLMIITLLCARRSKRYFYTLFWFVVLFSYITATLSFVTTLNPIAGIGWYFILLMTVFFIKGYRYASYVFIVLILTIILITAMKGAFTYSEIFLGVLPLISGYFFLYFFDRRNNNFKDIVESQKNSFEYQAHHDGLTGLPNRERFFSALSKLKNEAKYMEEKIAILFIDLDDFRIINDNLGHQIGDGVLVEVADRLNTLSNGKDILARFGGDEFSVILSGVKEYDEIEKYISNLFEVMKAPIRVEEYEIKVSFSVGCSIFPEDGKIEALLIGNADKAMYRAKKSTTKRYFFYSEIVGAQAP